MHLNANGIKDYSNCEYYGNICTCVWELGSSKKPSRGYIKSGECCYGDQSATRAAVWTLIMEGWETGIFSHTLSGNEGEGL